MAGMTSICVFPGQGAQKAGMGEGLFERFPSQVEAADRILGYSIAELCLENSGDRLGQTQFTQPALFVVSALGFLARQADGGSEVDYVAGHSLGEYTALFAAGAFSFEDGIRLVQERGRLMSGVSGGGMAAVIGMTPETIQNVLTEAGFSEIDLANQNSPKQTVIAGPKADVLACGSPLTEAGGKVIPLDVSGAFHSRQMRPVAEQYARFLEGVGFEALRIPVIANVTGLPYEESEVRETLARQIASPVMWSSSIQYLLALEEPEFEEIGPGKVLTGLIRQIKAGLR